VKSERNWYRQDGEYRMIDDVKVPGFIGGTRHLFHVCGKSIGVDSGVGLDSNGEVKVQYLPDGNNYVGERIDLILETHKHFDHSGSLPSFAWHQKKALMLMSQKTFDGTRVTLENSYHIAIKEEEKVLKMGLPIPKLVFTEEQLDFFYNNPNLRVVDLPWWVDLNKEFGTDEWAGWEIGLHSAGHDVGASSFFIITPDGDRIFLTGDIASHPTVVPGVMLPDEEFLGDFFTGGKVTMITEATNGGLQIAKPRSEINREWDDIVRKTYERGGIVFNPSYAASKGSDRVLKSLHLGLPIVVDGLVRNHMRIELPVDELIKSGKIVFIEEDKNKQEEAWRQRMEYARGERGCVIYIASSATLNQGIASAVAPEILPNEKNTTVFTGHVFDDSVAKTILEIERGRTLKMTKLVKDRVEPIYVNVRCDVHHLDDSSHDYQDGLVERVRLARPETLIVHHCPGKESFDAFAKQIRSLPHPPKKLIWGLNGRKILF